MMTGEQPGWTLEDLRHMLEKIRVERKLQRIVIFTYYLDNGIIYILTNTMLVLNGRWDDGSLHRARGIAPFPVI